MIRSPLIPALLSPGDPERRSSYGAPLVAFEVKNGPETARVDDLTKHHLAGYVQVTLPETNSRFAPENRPFHPIGNEIVFQLNHFQVLFLLLVSGSVSSLNYKGDFSTPGCSGHAGPPLCEHHPEQQRQHGTRFGCLVVVTDHDMISYNNIRHPNHTFGWWTKKNTRNMFGAVFSVWQQWQEDVHQMISVIKTLVACFIWGIILPKTNSSPLKNGGLKMSFLLGKPMLRCYVSSGEGILPNFFRGGF